jgi:hypothetical protein
MEQGTGGMGAAGGDEMNRASYSTYSTRMWDFFKRIFPKKTEREYCEMLSRNFAAVCANTKRFAGDAPGGLGLVWDRDCTYIDGVLEFLWRFRPITHYFLQPGVAEFCVSSVKEFSPEYCKRLPVCTPVDFPVAGREYPFVAPLARIGLGDSFSKIQGGFAVHFPASERQKSVMVIPEARIPIPEHALPVTEQGKGRIAFLAYFFASNDGEDTNLMQPSAPIDFNSDDNARWQARLVFGLSLYMDAFPDAVVAADDSNVKHVGHYTGARHMVSRNEIVDEEHRHSVSPHWRRGHFRLLSSVKFVRKQGQTVYVRGTFVKGEAFAVMDDANPTNQKATK